MHSRSGRGRKASQKPAAIFASEESPDAFLVPNQSIGWLCLRIDGHCAARLAAADAFEIGGQLSSQSSDAHAQGGPTVWAHEREPPVDPRPHPTEQEAEA